MPKSKSKDHSEPRNYWVYLTAALKGKHVGIEDIVNGI